MESFIEDVELKHFPQKRMQLVNGRIGLRLNRIIKDCVLLMEVENIPAHQVRHVEAQLNFTFH